MSALIEAARAALNYIEEPPAKLWPAGTLHRITINLRAALAAAKAQPVGDLVITKNDAGQIVAVTRQDEEGRILEVLAEARPAAQPLTDDQIAVLVLATVYEGDSSTPYRDAWASEIGIPFARAIEAAHGIGEGA